MGYLRDTIINATGLSNNNSCSSLFANPDFFKVGFKLKGDQYVQFIWCGVGIKLGSMLHNFEPDRYQINEFVEDLPTLFNVITKVSYDMYDIGK